MPSLPHLVMVPEVSHALPDLQQKPLLQSTELSPQIVSGPTEKSRAVEVRAKASGRMKLVARILRVYVRLLELVV